MSRFFKRDRGHDLETELRQGRPEPRPEFVAMLSSRIAGERSRRGRRGMRLGFAAALSAAVVISLAAVGGLGYAASAVDSAAHVAVKLVQPSHHKAKHKARVIKTSAAAQYGAKVTLCRNGHKIKVSQGAVAGQLAHGATRPVNGRCPAFRPHRGGVAGVTGSRKPRTTG